MCEPTTILLLASMAVSAVGAGMQKKASDRATIVQAETANQNLSATYAANQEASRSADAQAFEQQTDRVRLAERQLAMARVVSAQGGGSLAARAINITAASAEDFSRIDAGLDNKHGSVVAANAAGAMDNAGRLQASEAQLGANQTRFFSQLGEAAAKAGTTAYGDYTGQRLAKNYRLPSSTPDVAINERNW